VRSVGVRRLDQIPGFNIDRVERLAVLGARVPSALADAGVAT
jgi:hypothetical protein